MAGGAYYFMSGGDKKKDHNPAVQPNSQQHKDDQVPFRSVPAFHSEGSGVANGPRPPEIEPQPFGFFGTSA